MPAGGKKTIHMCLYPRLYYNKKYQANKKNGGVVPTMTDDRVSVVPVACGECVECRRKKSREWTVRLIEELRNNTEVYLVTLTFSEKALEELRSYVPPSEDEETLLQEERFICKTAIRYFTENWRKKFKKTIKHWFINELGHEGTERVHLHGLVWNTENIPDFKYWIKNKWKYGIVHFGEWVNEVSIGYLMKYVTKNDEDHPEFKQYIWSSNGMGKNYLNRSDSLKNKYQKGKTNENYTMPNGQKIQLPIYWRNHIYTEEEREKLWIEKLDKNKRFIMGIEIDINQDEKEYFRTLKAYQKTSERLGYDKDGTKRNFEWFEEGYQKTRDRMLNKVKLFGEIG